MRLGKIGLAAVVAAAALAAPGTAQAQDQETCVKNSSSPLYGTCIPVYQGDEDGICVSGISYCVYGVGENLQALNELIPDAGDLIPERFCTPSLLSGPICVGS